MMKNVLLFFALVIVAIQGWASPVDSLRINSTATDLPKQWNGVELADGTTLLNDFTPDESFCLIKPHDRIYNCWEIIWWLLSHPDEVKDFIDLIQDILEIAQDFETWSMRFSNIYNNDPIIPDDSSLFLGVTVGTTKRIQLQVTGFIQSTMYLTLDDPDNAFSIDKTTIQPDEAIFGATINVEFHPKSEGFHSAQITARTNLHSKIFGLGGNALERSITVTPIATSSFDDQTVGTSDYRQFLVQGKNLTSDLTVDWTDNSDGMFSIDKTSISYRDAYCGTLLTVTYAPTTSGTHAASFYIRGGGAPEGQLVALSGTAVERTISVSNNSLTFSNVLLGDSVTKVFTIYGTNLNENITLTPSGDNEMFSISPTSIVAAPAGTVTKSVAVTYKPTTLGAHNVTINISSGDAQSETVSLNGNAVSTPHSITVSPSTWDFGNVNVGETATKTFTVTGTNLSDRITMVTQYGSNSSNFTITPASLPASGGTVTVSYTPTTEDASDAEITFSDGSVSTRLSITGNGVIPPTISPYAASLNFGTVANGKEVSKTFMVFGKNLTGPLSLALTGATGVYSISPTTITAAEAAAGKTVTVKYKPTAGGEHNATVTISGGGATSKTVSLTGKCAAISVKPSYWDFGNVNVGTTVTKTFTVTGTNLSDRITMVTQYGSNSGAFTITQTSLPASGGTVTVTYKPSAEVASDVDITFGDGTVSTKLSITGNGVIPPTITPNASSLDFGTVAKGNTATKTFTVTGKNLTGSLTLSTNSSYFTVSPTTITAAEAAAGKTVTVKYKPTVKGTHNATLTINGGGAGAKTVSLKGKCVVPVISTNVSSLNYYQSGSKQFTVTGTDLTGNLTLTISGSSIFTLSKTSITASQAANGVTVSVLCNAPSSLQNATAKVIITGGGASSVSISLNYSQNQPLETGAVDPEGEQESEENELMNQVSLEPYDHSFTDVHELATNSKIYADGQRIIIESPVEQSAIISDMAGHAVTVNLQIGRNEIPVNASGIYIVRIREKSVKLMLK